MGDKEINSSEKKSNVQPNSLANLHPRKKGKAEKKYMQLDIKEFEDYLNLMSKYKNMTRTKYIMSLIRQDFEDHAKEYELLKELNKLENQKS